MLSMSIPLAERLRPHTLDEYIGQAHLVGQNGVFRKFLETGNVPSFILWGPPGVGKTTLAKIVATALKRPFYTLPAVTSSRNSSTPNRRSCSSTKSTASTSRSRTRCWVLSNRAW